MTLVGGSNSAGGGRGAKPPEQLVKCLPNFPAYVMADQQLEAALTAAGCTTANYSIFRQSMLRLARRADLSAADDWRDFMVLVQRLHIIQHQQRLPWDHQGGDTCSREVTVFVSRIEARAMSRELSRQGRSTAPPPRPQGPHNAKLPGSRPRTADSPASSFRTLSEQPDRRTDYMQFWHGGPEACQHKGDCKFPHRCKKCGSTNHGTGQHSPLSPGAQ